MHKNGHKRFESCDGWADVVESKMRGLAHLGLFERRRGGSSNRNFLPFVRFRLSGPQNIFVVGHTPLYIVVPRDFLLVSPRLASGKATDAIVRSSHTQRCSLLLHARAFTSKRARIYLSARVPSPTYARKPTHPNKHENGGLRGVFNTLQLVVLVTVDRTVLTVPKFLLLYRRPRASSFEEGARFVYREGHISICLLRNTLNRMVATNSSSRHRRGEKFDKSQKKQETSHASVAFTAKEIARQLPVATTLPPKSG